MSFVLGLIGGKLGWLAAQTVSRSDCSLTSLAENGPVPDLLTFAEVGRFLKVSVSSVRRLQQSRRIPFFKVGGSIRFSRRDVVAYLEKNRVVPPAP